MSSAPQPIAARQAVRWLRTYRTVDSRGFRRNVQGTFQEPLESIHRRLEADPGGAVSDALAALAPAHPGMILSYVAQAADLALSADEISEGCDDLAGSYSNHAALARELHTFCKGRAPIHLWMPLEKLAEFLQAESKRHKNAPAGLQIKRTSKTDTAPPTLALRHLAKRLREEFRIARVPHEPVETLVRIALGLDQKIRPAVVKRALASAS